MNNLTIPMTLSIDSPIPLQLQQRVVPRLSMTNELKTALLQIAEKVAYIDDNGQQYYQDLYDALYPPAATYTITNTLTGCTSSNSAVAITEGDSYSATITASSGYSLTGATVSITMGGSDITASAYNAGTISIASVTGDLSITVTAVAVTLSSISAVYTQSGIVYDTDSLDSLKSDLVVTATWSDTSTSTVASADYTLSGTLTVGTSTVTVSYGGKTTTFTVTVTVAQANLILNYKFADITLSHGYIGDDGNPVAADNNYYYDEFIDAVGFWLASASSVYFNNGDLYLRIASYDSSKQFVSRSAVQRGNPAVNANASFIKMGSNLFTTAVQSNADRFVACNILDTSICTIPNKTIDASGAEAESNDDSISDFLPVEEGTMICQLVNTYDSALVVFYDESKTFISRNGVTNSLSNKRLVMAIPNNAKFVRFRCPTHANDNIYVSYKKL